MRCEFPWVSYGMLIRESYLKICDLLKTSFSSKLFRVNSISSARIKQRGLFDDERKNVSPRLFFRRLITFQSTRSTKHTIITRREITGCSADLYRSKSIKRRTSLSSLYTSIRARVRFFPFLSLSYFHRSRYFFFSSPSRKSRPDALSRKLRD